jgi:hypothetical protein
VPAIWFIGGTANGTDLTNGLITHNYVKTHVATGILVQTGVVATVSYNYLQNLNSAAFDSGCIYSQFTTGCSFLYNYVRDGKSATYNTPNASDNNDRDIRALYCDANTNDITIQFNIIAGHAADTSGTSPTFDDTFKFGMLGQGSGTDQNLSYNIFDMGTRPCIAIQNSSTGSGNQFVGNIILSKFSGNPSSPSFGSWYQSYSGGGSPSAFMNGPNVYHNYGGGSVYTTGDPGGSPVVSDSNPQNVDPEIFGWTYNIAGTSPVFSSPVNFPSLPSNWGQPGFWGPPDFNIPIGGADTAPSCPH